VTFAFLIAVEKIGYKIYLINTGWDIWELLFVIFYWIETKNKTPEKFDEVTTGIRHSDALYVKVLEEHIPMDIIHFFSLSFLPCRVHHYLRQITRITFITTYGLGPS
jgi:hypothetical protein